MRSHFHRSALVRRLAGALPAGAAAPGDGARQDVAERLGQWLSVVDAIGLSSAHAGMASAARQASRQAPAPASAAAILQAELARVRAVLTRGITTRQARHQPDPQDLDTEFVLCLQAYQDQQRRMALSVDALREHARRTLAQGTPAQAQLAALDAALEQMLGPREQRLLGDLPGFLKARWTALRQAAAAQQAPDTPDMAGPARPAGASRQLDAWHVFNEELGHLLLAELDHRLQPVTGLIESLTP